MFKWFSKPQTIPDKETRPSGYLERVMKRIGEAPHGSITKQASLRASFYSTPCGLVVTSSYARFGAEIPLTASELTLVRNAIADRYYGDKRKDQQDKLATL